ncbi:MAG TPA: TlpA disulfide reductase family protein [Thermoanaerobaculia bacterium]
MRPGVLFGVALAVTAAAAAFPTRLSAQSPPPAATPRIRSIRPGVKAPDFQLESIDGKMVKLSDFKGKTVLLNFWATWCGPCRAEMPWLVDLYTKYRDAGLEIVGVSMDQNAVHRPRVVPYIREKNVTYTILYGNDRVAAAYDGVPLLPTSFFIGSDGKIVGEFEGIKTKNDLELGVLRALAPPELRSGAPKS